MTDPLSISLLLVAAGLAIFYFVFASFAFGAGYQPAPRRAVLAMLDLAAVGSSDFVVDLGAGTGAIVFRAARERGARVLALELEPIRFLVLWLRRAVGGPRDRVALRWGDLFDADLKDATVVTCFLWPRAMQRLRPILEERLAPGARVLSHWHPIPGWEAAAVDRAAHVFLYRWDPASTAARPTSGGPAPSGAAA